MTEIGIKRTVGMADIIKPQLKNITGSQINQTVHPTVFERPVRPRQSTKLGLKTV